METTVLNSLAYVYKRNKRHTKKKQNCFFRSHAVRQGLQSLQTQTVCVNKTLSFARSFLRQEAEISLKSQRELISNQFL